jgi:hypothetical protein
MPYKIVQHGHKFSVVAETTGRVMGTHPSKNKAQAQLAALHINDPHAQKNLISGGEGWTIEFSTPDCQHGWAILKGGTAQSIGCYMTKEAAEEALSALQNDKIDILSDEVRTTKTPEEFKENNVVQINKTSFWDGVFTAQYTASMGPNFHTQNQDDRYYFPSKATYENDGKPSVGYGNRSSNNSIPEGNSNPDKTTRPYKQ